jgi:hypothetical protein
LEILEEGDNLPAGHCQVCGEQLRGELQHCPLCNTPHHTECWEYIGGCSTYGCEATSREP